MNKKIILLISIFVIIIIACAIMLNNKKNKCTPFSGGSYNLIFITNSNQKINSIRICIACPPDSYDKLPIPLRDGYKFDGWYYDKELKNKVNAITTNEIIPITKKDKNNCIIGYYDIKLYAKWTNK